MKNLKPFKCFEPSLAMLNGKYFWNDSSEPESNSMSQKNHIFWKRWRIFPPPKNGTNQKLIPKYQKLAQKCYLFSLQEPMLEKKSFIPIYCCSLAIQSLYTIWNTTPIYTEKSSFGNSVLITFRALILSMKKNHTPPEFIDSSTLWISNHS